MLCALSYGSNYEKKSQGREGESRLLGELWVQKEE